MSIAEKLGYVTQEAYNTLKRQLEDANAARIASEEACEQAMNDATYWREEAARELENGERLTRLAARAVMSAEILEKNLTERQVAIDKQGKPGDVHVVDNLKDVKNKRHGFVPLRKRRQLAIKREDAEQVKRNALPRIKAELPPVPLTQADRDAMRETIELLEKETV